MKTLSGKAFCRVLEKEGWHLARVQGSHWIYCKAGHRERITVPVHANQDLKRGLQFALMRIAGLRDQDL
jgi:predicted RNA binding protein YcfA (HicA-like mRNA interferase family)